jgi:hypothetical protein
MIELVIVHLNVFGKLEHLYKLLFNLFKDLFIVSTAIPD